MRKRLRNWPLQMLALALVGAVLAAGAGFAAAQAAEPEEDEVVAWIRDNAKLLDTADPAAPLDDLAPLEAMVGDAAIVGLGESSHGAREEFLLKHRVVRFLVEEMDFRSLALEDDFSAGYKLNRYILTGQGDLDALARELSTTFALREIRDVLQYLRDYNATHDDKVQFLGVEFFATRQIAYDTVAGHVAKVAPAMLPEVRAHLRAIRPRTDDTGRHLQWYLSVPDKRPYVRHAQQLYELVKGLPHEKGDQGFELALQFARQIRSYYEFFTIQDPNAMSEYRDARAAQNLRWWRQRTGDKIAYWAAMAHTANGPDVQFSAGPEFRIQGDNAGSHLRRWYGQGYRSIGFTFDHGSIPGETGPVAVPRPEPGWGDRPLGDAGLDHFVLDLRGDAPAAVRAWREAPTKVRMAGDFDPRHPAEFYMAGGSLAQWLDVVVHTQLITPVTPL